MKIRKDEKRRKEGGERIKEEKTGEQGKKLTSRNLL